MTINLNAYTDCRKKFFKETQGVDIPEGQPLAKEMKFDRKALYGFIDAEISEMTGRVHKYQTAFNEIILDFLKADMLDVYKAGFIDMRKQYLTIGVNGLTDAAEFLGLENFAERGVPRVREHDFWRP